MTSNPMSMAQSSAGPVCRAPFVAMEFDPFGDVQACCANSLYPLGNVAESSLIDMWRGERAQKLRHALSVGELGLGCHICRFRLTHGHGELAQEYYEHFPIRDDNADWPFSLQFSLHNTCNLACVMCGADRSSKIRSSRTDLAPLPRVYGDQFFEEIEPFLEHAGAVDLSGGEPFLIAEHGRIWDLLIAMDPKTRPLCSLTTNGTVWNERTERVLGELDTHISVSVDGMTPGTFEAIRVGASFQEVFTNIDRFLAYTKERGTIMTMSWSLIRQNWFELGAAARFAEEKGIQLKVQTVIEPEFGLQRIPTDELTVVIEALEHEDKTLAPDLVLNRAMWEREIKRLHEELDRRRRPGPRALSMEPPSPTNKAHVVTMILDRRAHLDATAQDKLVDQAERDLRDWCSNEVIGRLSIDKSGTITSLHAAGILTPLGLRPGNTLIDLFDRFEQHLEGQLWIGDEHQAGHRLDHLIWIGREVRDKAGRIIRLSSIPGPDDIEIVVGVDDQLMRRPDRHGHVEQRVTLAAGRRPSRPGQ